MAEGSVDPQAVADARLAEALEASGARDPREFYREQLRELKEMDGDGYQKAVAWYRDQLIPSIAAGGADPLRAWTEYGRALAELRAPGRTVSIDRTGRSESFSAPSPASLILHLPEEKRQRAILVALPPDPSEAQRATFQWLVAGKLKLPESSGQRQRVGADEGPP